MIVELSPNEVDEDNSQYNSLPKISQEFIDEVFIRTKNSLEALKISFQYNGKISESKSETKKLAFINFVLFNFAMINFFPLVEGGSKLSIVLHEDKTSLRIKVQKAKLKKLFPSISTNDFLSLHKGLETILNKNNDLVHQMKWTRHNKWAHADVSWYEHDKREVRLKSIKNKLVGFFEEFSDLFISIGFVGFN